MRSIEAKWASPQPKDIMSAILQITVMARQVYGMPEKLKSEHALSAAEVRSVLDSYEDVMDDFHVSVALPWKMRVPRPMQLICTKLSR